MHTSSRYLLPLILALLIAPTPWVRAQTLLSPAVTGQFEPLESATPPPAAVAPPATPAPESEAVTAPTPPVAVDAVAQPILPAEPPPPEGCRPLSDKAMALDLKAATAQSQKRELAEQLGLADEAVKLWTAAVEQCEGRSRERAQRNLSDNLKLQEKLREQQGAGPKCESAHKDASALQDLARQALSERRFAEASILFRKSEDAWDNASELCTGTQQEIANRRRDQSEIDGHNAEYCAPAFDRAKEQTQRLRASALTLPREEKQDLQMVAETLWRDAMTQCRGTAVLDTARNQAQTLARERGTPWVARFPAGMQASAPIPVKKPTPEAPATKPATAIAAAAATGTAQAPAKAIRVETPVASAAATKVAVPAPPPPVKAVSTTLPTPAPVPIATPSKAAVEAPSGVDIEAAKPATGTKPASASPLSALASALGSLATAGAAAKPDPAATTAAAAVVTAPAKNADAQPQPAEFVAGTTRFAGTFVRDADTPTYTGTGKLTWDNGDTFEGSLLNSQRHGRGLFVWANGQTYDGDWDHDKPVGQARMRFANGNQYEGRVANGLPQGVGQMRYASGDLYVGQFSAGVPQGKGVYTWKNGQQFDGEWQADQPNGQGTLRFANGNVYVGTVVNGVPSGRGRTVFSTGEIYEGTVVNGLPEGPGTFTWPSGDQYSGQWKNGKKNGQGVFTWKSGDRWEGIYENDQQTDKPSGVK